MRVVITGARGFIGSQVSRQLLARGKLAGPGGRDRPLRELVLLDQLPADEALRGDPRVRPVQGDATEPAMLATLFDQPVDAVFALGATLTQEAEADYARGLEVNLHGMLRLIDCCRAQPRPPRLVYTSSIAAFGGPLPDVVDDAQPLTPQTSYGTHKAMIELLINDGTRRGFIDGRSLRLPIVVVRPGPPTHSISDRVAAIVREPLRGRDVDCPLRPDTRVPLASVHAVARALIAVCDLPATAFGHTRSMNLPSLSATVSELADAVETIGRWRNWTRPVGRIRWLPDAALQAVVDAWPRRFESSRALALGIRADGSLREIIEHFINAYLSDSPRLADSPDPIDSSP
jgi:D-erythronate 2-dehydrogenase